MIKSRNHQKIIRIMGLIMVSLLALIMTRSLSAHNLQTKMVSMVFDKDTQDMLDAKIAGGWTVGDQLLEVGDELGMVIKVIPRDGTDTGVGGYVDFYVPNGVTVIDAGYVVPDGSGGYTQIPMKGQSLIAIGAGPIGAKSTPQLSGLVLGPNINGVTEKAVVDGSGLHRGTVAGVYGDTGIFYSTDPDTVLGTFGNFTVTNNSGDTIIPLNKWDAEQLAAYGIKGTTKPGYPTAPIIDFGDGRGNTPWGLGSGVAGPQSGYAWQFDKDVFDATSNMKAAAATVGPWKRIQYPGSRVAFDQPGLASTTLGIASIDAGSLGFDLNPANPLPSTISQVDTTSPKTVRWSIGQLTLNYPEYVWVKIRVDSALADIVDETGCPVFDAGTFGGDAGGDSNGKDHLWRYYEPSTVEWNGCLGLGKPTASVVIGTGEIFQYPISFYNLGHFDLTNVVVVDTLPGNVSINSAVPAPNGTNPLTWNVGTLKPGEKFEALVTVTSTGNGVMENVVCVSSDQINTCATDITVTGPFPYLIQNKTANVSSINPGGNVQYTIEINNIGNGPSGTPITIQEYLPPGFTFVSKDSVIVNGAVVTAGTTVNTANPNQPIFTVPSAINAGKKLLLTFTAMAGGNEGTFCNSFSSVQNGIPLTTGSLACVTIGGGKIGDTVFRDWNGNGVQDPVDEGMPGVTVELYDCGTNNICEDGAGDDNLVDTIVTDDDGQFLFEGLTEDNYLVKIAGGVPVGYSQTADPDGTCLPTPGPECDDQSELFLPDGSQNLNQDFGYQPGGSGSIGDRVWNDNGSGGGTSGDGLQNGTEPGINGVTVFLFEDTNGNGLIDPGDALIGTDVTSGDGNYTFTGLAEGLDYIVQIAQNDQDVSDVICGVSITCPVGSSTSNPQSIKNLSGAFVDADFGYYEPPPGSISGKAFQDENANGVFDGGDVEMPNVTVVLYSDTNGNGIIEPGEPQVATTETDGNGDYSFTNLGPGDYIVDIEQGDVDVPEGYSATIDEIPVNLAEGEDKGNVDFPFVQALSKSVKNITTNQNPGDDGVPGDILEYSIRPYYAGSQILKNVTVTDMIPEGTTYVGSSANLGGGFNFNTAGSFSKDTYIYQKEDTRNYGISEELFIDGKNGENSRALLHFDLPIIPIGATIDSATLTLEKISGNDDAAVNIGVYGVTRSWNEGDKDNVDCTADPGGTTWLTYDCVANWTTAGGDFLPAPASSTLVLGEATYNWNVKSLVEQWVAGTLVNNGLLLKFVTEPYDKDATFASGDNTTAAAKPTLTITYSTAELTWSLGSVQPGKIGQDKSGLNVYAFRGDGKPDFWKYSIDGDSWSDSVFAPGNVKEGGALTTDGTHIYALRGAGTKVFLRIDPAVDVSWTTLPGTPENVKMGGALTTDGTYVYALRGDGKTDAWRYTIGCVVDTATCWKNLTNLPLNVKEGGSITNDGTYLYALRGTGSKNIWRYQISSGLVGTWESLTNLPENVKAGGAITTDGTNLFVTRGDGKTNFWKYPIASGTSGTWVSLASTPQTVKEGGALAYDNAGGIYALRGAGKPDFWRYDIDSNSWDTSLSPTDENVKWGGALVVFGTLGDTTVQLKAYPTLISCDPAGDCPIAITVDMIVTNNGAAPIAAVQAPTNLTVCGGGACPGGAVAVKSTGPVPATASSLGVGETRTYTYVYNVTANAANVGSVFFGGEPDPLASFTPGTSNSVIVTPPLTFRVTIDGPPASVTQVKNTAQIRDQEIIPLTDSNEVITQLPAGEIGDIHFYDNGGTGSGIPGNGIQDGDEAGVPNATVGLVEDTNGNGKADLGELAIAIQFTSDGTVDVDGDGFIDPIGYYNFTNIPPGKYVVEANPQTVESPTAPGVYNTMIATTGEEIAAEITCLITCTTITTADFGFIEAAIIEGYVFHDVDNNGVKDGGELGLTPVTVTVDPPDDVDLGNGNGVPVDIVTEADGSYFIIVPPGEYVITYDTTEAASALPGSPPESETDKTTPTSLTVNVISGQESKNNNFGIDHNGTIGDTVFNDANGNGAQGPGEPGISGVTVQLWQDLGNGGSPLDVLLGTQATDPTGNYIFEGLDLGNYVVVVDPSTLPAGYTPTADPDEAGICTTCNNQGSASITTDGQDIDTIDFGYQPPAGTYPISGNIWDDQNGNGVDDGAGEPGLPDVTVCLYESDGLTLITCTQTDSNGNYIFPGNPNGTYVIKVDPTTLPPAANQTGDPDETGTCIICDNQTTVTVNGGPEGGNNFGYQEVFGSISGTVCEGAVVDGQCVTINGDTPISTSIQVTLTYAGPDGILGTADDVVTNTNTTSGAYSFPNLPPGLYQITSDQAPLSPLVAAADADGTNPNNITVPLGSGENRDTRDFEIAQPLAIGLLGVAPSSDSLTLTLVLLLTLGTLALLTVHLLHRKKMA